MCVYVCVSSVYICRSWVFPPSSFTPKGCKVLRRPPTRSLARCTRSSIVSEIGFLDEYKWSHKIGLEHPFSRFSWVGKRVDNLYYYYCCYCYYYHYYYYDDDDYYYYYYYVEVRCSFCLLMQALTLGLSWLRDPKKISKPQHIPSNSDGFFEPSIHK